MFVVAVMCSEPPRVLNSDVLVNGYNVGDTAVYTCYNEFISNVGQTWESTCVLDVNNGLKAAWEPTEECIGRAKIANGSKEYTVRHALK